MQMQTILASTTFQQPGNSQRKWAQQSELNLHNKLPNAVQLRTEWCASGKFHAEISFEVVSYCDFVQNLETVQFLISKMDLGKPNDGYLIVNREMQLLFCFVGMYS